MAKRCINQLCLWLIVATCIAVLLPTSTQAQESGLPPCVLANFSHCIDSYEAAKLTPDITGETANCDALASLETTTDECFTAVLGICSLSVDFTDSRDMLSMEVKSFQNDLHCVGDCVEAYYMPCLVQFNNTLDSIKASASIECSDFDDMFDASDACFAALKDDCEGVLAFDVAWSTLFGATAEVKRDFNCDIENVANCDQSKRDTISECLDTYSTLLNSLSEEVETGNLEIERMSQICSELNVSMNTAKTCMNTAYGGDTGCNEFHALYLQTVDFLATPFETECDMSKCPFETTEALSTCYNTFSSGVAELTNNMENTEEGVRSFCQFLAQVRADANLCLYELRGEEANCGEDITDTETNIESIVQQYNVFCDEDELHQACPLTVRTTVTECLESYSEALTILSLSILGDQATQADVEKFCNSISPMAENSTNCITKVTENEVSCTSVADTSKDSVKGVASQYDDICGGGNLAEPCPFSLQMTMTKCFQTFSQSINSLDVFGASVTQEGLNKFCSSLEVLIENGDKCLEEGSGDNELCYAELDNKKERLHQLSSQFDNYCSSSRCEPEQFSTCLAGGLDRLYTANIVKDPLQGVTFDLSTSGISSIDSAAAGEFMAEEDDDAVSAKPDFKQLCDVNDFMRNCKKTYTKACHKNIGQVENPFLLKLLETINNVQGMCDKDCEQISTLYTNLEICVDGATATLIPSFNGICTFLKSVFDCAKTQTGNCDYVTNVLLRDTDPVVMAHYYALFGCESNGPYADCSMANILACNNVLITPLGLPMIDVSTNFDTFGSKMGRQPIFRNNTFNGQTSCSGKSELDFVRTCYVEESKRCPRHAILSEYDISNMDVGAVPTLYQSLSHMSFNFSSMGYNFELVGMRCEGGYCQDYNNRWKEFYNCVWKGLESSTLTQTYNETALGIVFGKEIQQMLSQYNHGEDYAGQGGGCSRLEVFTTCGGKHFKGCDANLHDIANKLDPPQVLAALELCQIDLTFTMPEVPAVCSNKEYVHKEVEFVAMKCGASLGDRMLHGHVRDKTTVCQAFQDSIECYARHAKCHYARKILLEPRLVTWAMMNHLYECDLKLRRHYGDSAFALGDIDPETPSCDYAEILQCYEPLLSKVGVIPQGVITDKMIKVFMELPNLINADISTLCVDKSEINNMVSCARAKSVSCLLPKTYTDTLTGSGQDFSDIVSSNEGMAPLADLLHLEDIKSICTQECKQSITSCDLVNNTILAKQVVWKSLLGQDIADLCGEFQKFKGCINQATPNCAYSKRRLDRVVGPVYEEAKWRCDDFQKGDKSMFGGLSNWVEKEGLAKVARFMGEASNLKPHLAVYCITLAVLFLAHFT